VKITVQTSGFAELERALADLGKLATQKAAARRALMKAAEPIADVAKRLAPVREGYLRDSIVVSTKVAGGDAGLRAFGQTLAAGGSRQDAVSALRDARRAEASVVMYVGPGQHPQAIMQEFGTVHHAPQPFMRPAWDAEGRATLDRLAALMWAEIEKTARRNARRAARAAARAAAG
jgi:HK97 gp10 family phage protein